MQHMAARVLPLIALLFTDAPTTNAGHESALALERVSSASPFQIGDQLQLDSGAAKKLNLKEVTVLQTGCWPWVLVRENGAEKASEVWVNFMHISGARRIARAEAGAGR